MSTTFTQRSAAAVKAARTRAVNKALAAGIPADRIEAHLSLPAAERRARELAGHYCQGCDAAQSRIEYRAAVEALAAPAVAAQALSGVAMVAQPVQQAQAFDARAQRSDAWVRIDTRHVADTLNDAVEYGHLHTYHHGNRTVLGLPVIQGTTVLGWAENEEAAAVCGHAWGLSFDGAFLILNSSTGDSLCYALLGGTGGPVDSDPDDFEAQCDADQAMREDAHGDYADTVASRYGCGADDTYDKSGQRRRPRLNDGGEPNWF